MAVQIGGKGVGAWSAVSSNNGTLALCSPMPCTCLVQHSSRGGDSEELPDGTKVSQIKLANWAVLAAFAYLYHKKLIDFVLEEWEMKGLFRKTKIKTVKVIKLQSTAPGRVYFAAGNSLRSFTPGTSGLEAVIFTSLRDHDHIYGLTGALIDTSTNPWREVLQIMKENLVQRGILKLVVNSDLCLGKRLFPPMFKYVVNGDISKEAKQVPELIKTLKELQAKGELYQQMLSDIAKGIASREDTDSGD